jgi:hypothetical protein
VVVHHDPVRIPFSALPTGRRPEPRGSIFASTFVIGTAAAPWFAGAFLVGGNMAGTFALAWSVILALNLVIVLRRL